MSYRFKQFILMKSLVCYHVTFFFFFLFGFWLAVIAPCFHQANAWCALDFVDFVVIGRRLYFSCLLTFKMAAKFTLNFSIWKYMDIDHYCTCWSGWLFILRNVAGFSRVLLLCNLIQSTQFTKTNLQYQMISGDSWVVYGNDNMYSEFL